MEGFNPPWRMYDAASRFFFSGFTQVPRREIHSSILGTIETETGGERRGGRLRFRSMGGGKISEQSHLQREVYLKGGEQGRTRELLFNLHSFNKKKKKKSNKGKVFGVVSSHVVRPDRLDALSRSVYLLDWARYSKPSMGVIIKKENW